MIRLRSAAVPVLAFFLGAAIALWFWPEGWVSRPLHPIVSVAFDASRAGSCADVQVQIPQHRSWVIAIWFPVSDLEDFQGLDALVRGETFRGQRIRIPFHIVVEKSTENGLPGPVIYQKDISSIKPHAFWPHHYETKLATLNLKPGTYRIRVQALADNRALNGRPANFTLDYWAKTAFADDAESLEGQE